MDSEMKVTPQQRIVRFLECKQELIEDLTELQYITEEDLLEVITWDTGFCDSYIEALLPPSPLLSPTSCPWCEKWKVVCSSCGYGRRHGECLEAGSDYQKIISEMGDRKHDLDQYQVRWAWFDKF